MTQSAQLIEKGNRGKGRPDPPGGKKARQRRGGHHTLTLLAWERTRCNTTGETPGTDSSGVTRVNVCPLPSEASLNTGFPTPFLRSLMLRTRERASSAGADECTFVISIREENFKFVSQFSPQRRKLFSNLSVFKWFGLADNDIWVSIILISSNKVLTFGSCFKCKPARHRTCFAMNSDRFVVRWQIGFFPKLIDPLCNPFVVLFAREPE